MINKISFLIALFSAFSINAQSISEGDSIIENKEVNGVNKLVLKNISSGETVNVEEGSKVVVFSNSNKRLKGTLLISNDSIINIDNQSININEIKQFEVKKNTRTAGVVLTVLSAGLITGGVVLLIQANKANTIIELLALGILGVGSGIGGAVLLIPSIILTGNNIGNIYKTTEWDYEIIIPETSN